MKGRATASRLAARAESPVNIQYPTRNVQCPSGMRFGVFSRRDAKTQSFFNGIATGFHTESQRTTEEREERVAMPLKKLCVFASLREKKPKRIPLGHWTFLVGYWIFLGYSSWLFRKSVIHLSHYATHYALEKVAADA